MANGPYQDLLKDSSESFEDGNYFIVTIVDLDLGSTYPIQFRYKYKDGTFSKDWSAVYQLNTPISTPPNEPQLQVSDVVGLPEKISVTWSGNDANGNPIENFDRVDVHIAGTTFGDGTKPAGNFKKAGTLTFAAQPGIYIVQLKAYRVDGTASFFSSARTVTVTKIEELIETPVVPTGFSARTILGGIELTWDGTYYGGVTWSGFQAINVYAGTSSSATSGTYIKVGQMTANKTTNKIVIPIDGTYVRYGYTAYIHASSINKATPPVESSVSANVASATPSQVVNTDIINSAITAAKIDLAAVTEVKIDTNAVTTAKIAANAITETKIANDAVTSAKIIAGAITAAKIDVGAVTAEKISASAVEADKIAANAITAGKIAANAITASNIVALAITGDKIAANTIDVGKLAANTISVGNLSAGDINASSYIRAGSAGAARVEIASTTVGSVLPGLTVYDSGGNQMLRAPLSGGLTVTGSLTATQISTSSGKFAVNTSGILTASDVDLTGTIKASGGNIGGITIASDGIQNSGNTFKLDNTGKARFGSVSGSAIILNPVISSGAAYLYHVSDGINASGNFTFLQSGGFRLGGSGGINYDGSNTITLGSSGNPVTINTSTGNVSISGILTAGNLTDGTTVISGDNIQTGTITGRTISGGTINGATINVGSDFWKSNGDFQIGGSNGISYSANGISIGYLRIGINPASSTYGNLYSKDLDLFIYGQSTDTYAIVSNTRPISIGGYIYSASYIQANGKISGKGTNSDRSEFDYLGILYRARIAGGYGIDSDWSPQFDNTYTLGQAPSNRWQRVYANNTTISTSDIRLKKDIIDSPLGLDFINNLRPVGFKWIIGKNEIALDENGNEIQIGIDKNEKPIFKTLPKPGIRRHYGFIAQEVKEAVDSSGVDDFAGWVKDDLSDTDSTESLSYEQFIAPLTKAVQELSQQVNELKQRLDALEG